MSNHTHLKIYLKDLAETKPISLAAQVATEALEYGGEDISVFFTDLLLHGCASGIVGSLIYYADTHAFYDKHYREIEALRYELEDSMGAPLHPQGDLKNWYAWLAFEETARSIADQFGLEV